MKEWKSGTEGAQNRLGNGIRGEYERNRRGRSGTGMGTGRKGSVGDKGDNDGESRRTGATV